MLAQHSDLVTSTQTEEVCEQFNKYFPSVGTQLPVAMQTVGTLKVEDAVYAVDATLELLRSTIQ